MDAIKHHNFCMTDFFEMMQRQGFSVSHSGGSYISDDNNQSVTKIHQQYRLGNGKHTILTCSATSFYKTFLSVEESFDFLLFG